MLAGEDAENEAGLSEYELERIARIRRNREIMKQLGLADHDIVAHRQATAAAVARLHAAGIVVSLFIDPEPRQIEVAADLGVAAVELHTGEYANATSEPARHDQLVRLARAATAVRDAKLVLNAGHGLTYRNVVPVAQLEGMHELNIGHSIVSRAVLVGFTQAVREMKALIEK